MPKDIDHDMTDQDELFDDEELWEEQERRDQEELEKLADLEGLPDVPWKGDLVRIQDPDDKAEAIREAEDIQRLEREVLEKRGRGKGMDYQVHFEPMRGRVVTRAREAVLKSTMDKPENLQTDLVGSTELKIRNQNQGKINAEYDPLDFVPYGRQVIMDVLKTTRDLQDTSQERNPSESIPTQPYSIPDRLEDLEEPLDIDPENWTKDEPDDEDLMTEEEILARGGASLAEQLQEVERLERERAEEPEPNPEEPELEEDKDTDDEQTPPARRSQR